MVLLLDEIDALKGSPLLSVLHPLRDGFHLDRPQQLPFNIKLESLRIGDFDRADVDTLLDQHTADTGQVFTQEAWRLWRRIDADQGPGENIPTLPSYARPDGSLDVDRLLTELLAFWKRHGEAQLVLAWLPPATACPPPASTQSDEPETPET